MTNYEGRLTICRMCINNLRKGKRYLTEDDLSDNCDSPFDGVPKTSFMAMEKDLIISKTGNKSYVIAVDIDMLREYYAKIAARAAKTENADVPPVMSLDDVLNSEWSIASLDSQKQGGEQDEKKTNVGEAARRISLLEEIMRERSGDASTLVDFFDEDDDDDDDDDEDDDDDDDDDDEDDIFGDRDDDEEYYAEENYKRKLAGAEIKLVDNTSWKEEIAKKNGLVYAISQMPGFDGSCSFTTELKMEYPDGKPLNLKLLMAKTRTETIWFISDGGSTREYIDKCAKKNDIMRGFGALHDRYHVLYINDILAVPIYNTLDIEDCATRVMQAAGVLMQRVTEADAPKAAAGDDIVKKLADKGEPLYIKLAYMLWQEKRMSRDDIGKKLDADAGKISDMTAMYCSLGIVRAADMPDVWEITDCFTPELAELLRKKTEE